MRTERPLSNVPLCAIRLTESRMCQCVAQPSSLLHISLLAQKEIHHKLKTAPVRQNPPHSLTPPSEATFCSVKFPFSFTYFALGVCCYFVTVSKCNIWQSVDKAMPSTFEDKAQPLLLRHAQSPPACGLVSRWTKRFFHLSREWFSR